MGEGAARKGKELMAWRDCDLHRVEGHASRLRACPLPPPPSPPRPNLILSVCLDSASLVSTLPSLLYTPPAAMPYVDLVSGDDYASIWYDTNARESRPARLASVGRKTVVTAHDAL